MPIGQAGGGDGGGTGGSFKPTKANLYAAIKAIFHPATNAGVTADDANNELDVAAGTGGTFSGVQSDATLGGDGTSGSPLKVATPYTATEKAKLGAIESGATVGVDIHEHVTTSATPASSDRFIFSDENVSGDPNRYVTYTTLRTAIRSGLATLGVVLLKAGGTMTGALTLSGAPTSNRHAATKKYVDDEDAKQLPLSGGTLTGALTLSGAPTADLHSATKKYVDDNAGTGGSNIGSEAYAYYAAPTLASPDVSTDQSIARTGDGYMHTLLDAWTAPAGIVAGADFVTEWEGLITFELSTACNLQIILRTKHVIGAKSLSHERSYFVDAAAGVRTTIPMAAFNSRSRVRAGMFGGTSITAEDIAAASEITYELEFRSFPRKNIASRNTNTLKFLSGESVETYSYQDGGSKGAKGDKGDEGGTMVLGGTREPLPTDGQDGDWWVSGLDNGSTLSIAENVLGSWVEIARATNDTVEVSNFENLTQDLHTTAASFAWVEADATDADLIIVNLSGSTTGVPSGVTLTDALFDGQGPDIMTTQQTMRQWIAVYVRVAADTDVDQWRLYFEGSSVTGGAAWAEVTGPDETTYDYYHLVNVGLGTGPVARVHVQKHPGGAHKTTFAGGFSGQAKAITDETRRIANAALPKTGGTMTGKITLDGAPTSNLHAATKKYVDDNAGGMAGGSSLITEAFSGDLGGASESRVGTVDVENDDDVAYVIHIGTEQGYLSGSALYAARTARPAQVAMYNFYSKGGGNAGRLFVRGPDATDRAVVIYKVEMVPAFRATINSLGGDAVQNVAPVAGAPTALRGFSAAAATLEIVNRKYNDDIEIEWSNPANWGDGTVNTREFEIQYATMADFSNAISTDHARSVRKQEVKSLPDATYYCRGRAKTDNGDGPWSNTVTVVISAAALSLFNGGSANGAVSIFGPKSYSGGREGAYWRGLFEAATTSHGSGWLDADVQTVDGITMAFFGLAWLNGNLTLYVMKSDNSANFYGSTYDLATRPTNWDLLEIARNNQLLRFEDAVLGEHNSVYQGNGNSVVMWTWTWLAAGQPGIAMDSAESTTIGIWYT